LIRETMAHDARLAHEAEVFLGGILEVIQGDPYVDPDGARYGFYPGVRELLLEALPSDEAYRVLANVSEYIEHHFGKLRGFRAFVMDLRQVAPEMVNDETGFAKIAVELLARFGGDYAEAAELAVRALTSTKVPQSADMPSPMEVRDEETARDAASFDQRNTEGEGLASGATGEPALPSRDVPISAFPMHTPGIDGPSADSALPPQAQIAADSVARKRPSVDMPSTVGLPLPARRTTGTISTVEVSIARLPATGQELFGREMEVAWLDACWQERARVATVVAWGGIGKSALVNRWLAGQRDKGWDGAAKVYAWSFCSQGTDRLGSSDEFIDAALRWFGDLDPMQGSTWDKGERLARLVRKERTLLILDGVEPLQWGPGVQLGKLKDPALEVLVKELGAQNKGLCLITSRVALTDLHGLGGDKVRAKDLGGLSPEAGAELLKARGAKGTEEALREASSEYKGHGLALTLLGGYIRKRHKGDIRQRAHIPVLEGRPAQRMMGIYERWFAGKPEIAVLRMLGLFDRPASDDEIEALRALPYIPGLTMFLKGLSGSAWNEAVTTLQDVGLLAPASDHDDRLDAHPLVREHFGAQLREKHPGAWCEGHRRLYVYLRNAARPLPETLEEMAPLYAAVVHGCRAGKSQEALVEVYWKRIQRQTEHFSSKKLGALGTELGVLAAFFDPPWERLAGGLGEPAQAFILSEAGFVLRSLGRLPAAAVLMRQGLELDIARKAWSNAAAVASNLSELLQALGELPEAQAQARKSVELAEASGDAVERTVNRTTLAAALHATGARELATAEFEDAERRQQKREPASPRLYSLQGFRYCDLLLDQGRDAEVRARAAQTLEFANEHFGLISIALDHLSLGRAQLLGFQRGTADDLAQATSHIQQAVDGLRRAGDQSYTTLGLLARAALYIHTRDFLAARHDLDETLTLATRCGFRLHEADAHLGYARLALAEGHSATAREHLAKARRIIGETGYHRRDGELAEFEATASTMVETAPPSIPPPAPAPRIARSMSSKPTTQPVDLGIIVALPEELRELLDLVKPYVSLPDPEIDAFLFTRGNYRCAVTLVGEMGESQAAVFTERLISILDPGILLSIGIAGGVHDDLRAGDVHVPSQAAQYMQDSKAAPTADGGFAIVPGAPAYRADFALLKAARGFEFHHAAEHTRWQAECAADLALLLTDGAKRESLVTDKLVRDRVKLLADGHVATGPVVGAAAAFTAWIRSHDRNVKSLEMESAAVLLAAQTRSEPKKALAIRGISDGGNDRKKEHDALGEGVLRKYGMRNAMRFLLALLDAEVLPRNPR
jgi:nucleoside phosphorylase